MKNLILVSVLASLLVLATPVFAAEAVTIGYSVADATVRPGSQTNIQLTVSNPGTADTPTYISLFLTAGPYLTVDPSTASIASLGLGSSQLTNVNVKVASNAISTTSYVTIKATYIVSGSSRDTSITIPIKIRRTPVLQLENVTYSKSPEPGTSTVLSFYVMNNGEGPAEDLRVYLNQSSGIASAGSGGELYIRSLGSFNRQLIEFPITISPSTAAGLYSQPITLSYYDETKSDLTVQTKYIGIPVGGRSNFILDADTSTNFYFGRQGAAVISISNAGNSPAEFLIVKASSPYGTKEYYVGGLDSDDTETVDVVQDLSRARGAYDLDVTLTWKDKFGTEYTETRQVRLTPTGAPVQLDGGTLAILLIIAGAAFWKRKKLMAFVSSKLKK